MQTLMSRLFGRGWVWENYNVDVLQEGFLWCQTPTDGWRVKDECWLLNGEGFRLKDEECRIKGVGWGVKGGKCGDTCIA